MTNTVIAMSMSTVSTICDLDFELRRVVQEVGMIREGRQGGRDTVTFHFESASDNR